MSQQAHVLMTQKETFYVIFFSALFIVKRCWYLDTDFFFCSSL